MSEKYFKFNLPAKMKIKTEARDVEDENAAKKTKLSIVESSEDESDALTKPERATDTEEEGFFSELVFIKYCQL